MKTVWKFPLAVTDEKSVSVPHGAQFLCVQEQGDVPTAWFLVNPTNTNRQQWTFYIVGTGNPFPAERVGASPYVGSVQMHGGTLVWHVWLRWPNG